MIDNFYRADTPNYIIMFSDGGANINEDRVIPEAVKTRIAGAHITAVAVGKDLNMMALKGIVSDPVNRNVIFVDTYDQLTDDIVEKTSKNICDGKAHLRNTQRNLSNNLPTMRIVPQILLWYFRPERVCN